MATAKKRKTIPIAVRFPREVWTTIHAKAREEGDTPSGWIRRTVIRALRESI